MYFALPFSDASAFSLLLSYGMAISIVEHDSGDRRLVNALIDCLT